MITPSCLFKKVELKASFKNQSENQTQNKHTDISDYTAVRNIIYLSVTTEVESLQSHEGKELNSYDRNHILSYPGFWGHAGPIWFCQPRSASSHTDIFLQELDSNPEFTFLFHFIIYGQTANCCVFFFPQICQSIGQSSFQGNSPQHSKQISEWEVIISHQTQLPANWCQMLAGVTLPVSLYTQRWQTASQLFEGLFLFWKSSWTETR